MSLVHMALTAEAAAAIPDWMPPAGYRIRVYEPSDVTEWAQLLILYGPHGLWSVERLNRVLKDAVCGWLVTDYGDAIVAGVLCGHSGGVGPLGALIVHPTRRRNGLGFGLCAIAIAYLIEDGCTYTTAGTGDDDFHMASRKFHEKLGFEYK